MMLLFQYNDKKSAAMCCGIDDKNYDGAVDIPKSYNGVPVTAIRHEAFSKSRISSVHIPNTVTSIGMQAFAYNEYLRTVTFEKGSRLYIIEPLAFSGCKNLTHIRFPDSLHVIEHLAIKNCSCEIPNRCIVMTPNFERCKVTTYEPDLPPLAPIEKDAKGNEFRLNEARDGYIAVKILAEGLKIIVPDEFNGLPVIELGDMVFTRNQEAWSAIIPATVKKSGYFPFYACDEIGYADYNGNMQEWREMDIYTWFNVHCIDGIVEGHG